MFVFFHLLPVLEHLAPVAGGSDQQIQGQGIDLNEEKGALVKSGDV